MLTQSRLKELLEYNPETGVFTRLVRTANKTKIGDTVGKLHNKGYRHTNIFGKDHLLHRLAWLYMMGEWPQADIDHVNGVRDDNRFCNLREATRGENLQNMRMSPRNTSGFMGVYWCKHRKKWRAQIRVKGRTVGLGRFATPEDAYAAYLAAKVKYHTFNPVARSAKVWSAPPTFRRLKECY